MENKHKMLGKTDIAETLKRCRIFVWKKRELKSIEGKQNYDVNN